MNFTSVVCLYSLGMMNINETQSESVIVRRGETVHIGLGQESVVIMNPVSCEQGLRDNQFPLKVMGPNGPSVGERVNFIPF